MIEETCELCGHKGKPATTEIHHIVPRKLTEQAGMHEAQVVRLCCNCHREVHAWCSTKVSDVVYDIKTKGFRGRSWLEMVKEYQSAFSSFAEHKKGQLKTLPPSQRKNLIGWLRDYLKKLLIRLPLLKRSIN